MEPGDRKKRGDQVTEKPLRPQRRRQQDEMIGKGEATAQTDPEQSLDDPRAYITRYLRDQWPCYADNDQSGLGRRGGLVVVAPESLPSMDELRSFGELDRQEGIQACARLLRVRPVWKEACVGLWERLRDDAQTRKREAEESTPVTAATSPYKTRTPPCGRDRVTDVGEPRVQFHGVDWSGEDADNSEYASFWAGIREEPGAEPRSPKDTRGMASARSNNDEGDGVRPMSGLKQCRCCPREPHYITLPSPYFPASSRADGQFSNTSEG
jgi:hypothetical protein